MQTWTPVLVIINADCFLARILIPSSPGKRGAATPVYLLFEQRPDEGPTYLGYIQDFETAREKLDELSKTIKNELFVIDSEKKQIVLRSAPKN
jgi:hypothetical protein